MAGSDGAAEVDSPVAEGALGAAVAQAERKLIFTGDMGLRVKDVAQAMAAARSWTEAQQGFVEQESVSGERSNAFGQMTLRVPQAQYEAGRQHLRSLAMEVLNDDSQRQDVTGQHADFEARLRNLKATERELQELLGQVREQGGGAEDILSVYRELTQIRGQIESLQAQLDVLGEQVALSTLRVIFEPPPTSAADVSQSWHPGSVFRRALADVVAAFQWLVNVAIYLLVTSPFWLLPVVGVWLVWRWLRRRKGAAPPPSTPPAPPLPES